MRALIVSYYFPPAGGGGVQRVLKWAKYLPRFGVEVDVLTPDDPGWLQSDESLVVPDGVTVHRARNRSPRARRPQDKLRQMSGPARIAHKVLLQPRRLLYPDIHVGWSLAAVPAARRIVRERGVDVVISTSPPKTCHVIAGHVKRRESVPWIADFRDSWLDLPHLRFDSAAVRFRHMVDRWYASRLIGHADAVTTVSEPLAADLRRRHPNVPVSVVQNGIDLEDLRNRPQARPLACGAPRSDRFVIAYTGNFFGRQDPTTFLRGLELVLRDQPSRADSIVVRFVGELRTSDLDIVAEAQLATVVDHTPFLPHASVLAEQSAADMLLLYVAPGRGSAGVYTGKVFEYVASQRPVLALAPADNVAVELLERAGTGTRVDPDDVQAIAAEIRRAHDRWLEHGRAADGAVPASVMEGVSREHQGEQLAQLIASVTRRPR